MTTVLIFLLLTLLAELSASFLATLTPTDLTDTLLAGAAFNIKIFGSTLALGLHSLALGLLLVRSSLRRAAGTPAAAAVYPALMLIPLLRMLSYTVPMRPLPEIFWYAVVGLPLLGAAALTARYLRLTPRSMGLAIGSRRHWRQATPTIGIQVMIALSGLPLGLLGFDILRPAAVVESESFLAVLGASLVLAVFVGFTEEFVYRGVLQPTLARAFGKLPALLVTSLLFGIMYFGWLSLGYLIFMAALGLYFGYCAQETGSLWGVVGAHCLYVVGLGVAWPLVYGSF